MIPLIIEIIELYLNKIFIINLCPVLGQRPLAPSVTPVANDNGDNEMIPGVLGKNFWCRSARIS